MAVRHAICGTGVDTWAQNLDQGLRQLGTDVTMEKYSGLHSIFPWLLPRLSENSAMDIQHGNLAYGFAFDESIPIVVTAHHIVHSQSYLNYCKLRQRFYYKFLYRLEKKTLEKASAVVCPSHFTLRELEKVHDYHDSIVIHNGVDTDLFSPGSYEREDLGLPEGKHIVLSVGNTTRRKGFDLLPKISRNLGEDYLLVSTSGLRKDYELKTGRFWLLGRVSQRDLIRLYNLCDVYLSPSRLEGFGLTVAEAMSCGKPVVATNISALPEVVPNAKGGFLCPPDDVESFCSNIMRLCEDSGLRRRMGRYNRKRVIHNFSLKKMAVHHMDLYRSII